MLWKLAIVAALAAGASAFNFNLNVTERERLETVAQDYVAQYCLKNKAGPHIALAQKAVSSFRWCLERLGDFENLMVEIAAVKPQGDFVEILKNRGKYCAKTADLKACTDVFVKGVEPCTPVPFRHFVNIVTSGALNVANFLCFNNGDRIIAFINAKGPECIRSQLNATKQCFNETNHNMPDLFELVGSEIQRCHLYENLTTCIVKAMDQCPNKTPGNMADSLFKFMLRRITPCQFAKEDAKAIRLIRSDDTIQPGCDLQGNSKNPLVKQRDVIE